MEKQLGKTPVALTPPPFPEELLYLWEWFIQLSNSRGQGFNGPSPITFLELKAWCDLMNIKLSPWEVDVVKQIDSVYMKVVSNVRH